MGDWLAVSLPHERGRAPRSSDQRQDEPRLRHTCQAPRRPSPDRSWIWFSLWTPHLLVRPSRQTSFHQLRPVWTCLRPQSRKSFLQAPRLLFGMPLHQPSVATFTIAMTHYPIRRDSMILTTCRPRQPLPPQADHPPHRTTAPPRSGDTRSAGGGRSGGWRSGGWRSRSVRWHA